jgi:hypothetical protein
MLPARYFWVCPKCNKDWSVFPNFVRTKIECSCGNVYTIRDGDGTVFMKDGDRELPANAPPALKESLEYLHRYADLTSDQSILHSWGFLILGNGLGYLLSSVDEITNWTAFRETILFKFGDEEDMLQKIKDMYQKELSSKRGKAIAKLKEEVKKLGLKESDLF